MPSDGGTVAATPGGGGGLVAIPGVSLLAPVLGSVMPAFTGGLFAPEAAAGPLYTGAGAVPPESAPDALAAVPGPAVAGGAGACANADGEYIPNAITSDPAKIIRGIFALSNFIGLTSCSMYP